LFLKRLTSLIIVLLITTLLSSNLGSIFAQDNPIEIQFYYPTAVGGPITQVMDEFAAEFNAANPGIKVVPVYSGGYADTYKAIQTQITGGERSADVAILLTTDLYSLIDNDYIIPLNPYVEATENGEKIVNDFFPAFMENSVAYDQLWGMPFQRSTPVLYYNKDAFKEVGLDPEVAPQTWQDMLDAAKQLTKADGSRWGLEIPSDGFPYWLFQGFAISNGQNLVGEEANKVYFNTPSTVEALQFFIDLSRTHKVMPEGIIKWGDTPTDFTSGKAAMIYHTTGSLTNILANATFDVGVGFLPQGKAGYGTPTGGGNLYIFKSAPKENQDAAWKWIQFLTSAEIQARWGVATGYVASRKSAWETSPLKELAQEKPQYAGARDQLEFAQKELATHQGADIQQIFGKAVQAALIGEKTPQEALDEAQATADQILSEYAD
jgi:sn-glycerol 3-phosphate transport system substrate-binding protein